MWPGTYHPAPVVVATAVTMTAIARPATMTFAPAVIVWITPSLLTSRGMFTATTRDPTP
tara:strand:+ start:337 stop:513 length:177 start_codon:yes stop_codon:yes gene_type:complete